MISKSGIGPFAPSQSYLGSLLGGGLFVIAVTVLLLGWAIIQGRNEAHRTAEATTANLSQTLADNFTGAIDKIDLGLAAILDEVAEQQRNGPWDDRVINTIIASQDARQPNLTGFRIFGPDGKLRYALKNVANPNADLSQRDDFKILRDRPDSPLMIGPPAFGPLAQQWTIAVSRRISNPDGSFGGIVITSIPVPALVKTFSTLDLGPGGTVVLYHDSLRMAARVPEISGANNPVGTMTISDQLKSIILSGVSSRHYDYVSVVDGQSRTAHVRRVGGLPYVIAVGQSEEHYLAEWRRNRTYSLLTGAIIVGIVLAGMLVLHRRISDGQKARAALAESEAKLRGLFELSPLGIVRNTLDGRFVEFNTSFAELTGYGEDELKALDDRALTPPDYAKDEARQLESLRSAGRYGPFEKEYVRKDGSRIPLVFQGILMTGNDGKPYIWSLVEDIRERVAARNAMREKTDMLTRSNADLEQFAYAASHDLRAPLRGIRNLAGWVMEDVKGKVDGEALENLDLLQRRADRLDLLLEGLLEYSRIGRMEGGVEPVDIGRLVADIADYIAPPRGFLVEYRGDVAALTTHKAALEQVLRNLIGNAVKHHDQPEGSVAVSCHEHGDRVEFSVADDGPGIPAEYHDHVFKMFQTLKSRDQVEGSGMGLAIVKRAVERHGGAIRIESEPTRRGTAFVFTWGKGA